MSVGHDDEVPIFSKFSENKLINIGKFPNILSFPQTQTDTEYKKCRKGYYSKRNVLWLKVKHDGNVSDCF